MARVIARQRSRLTFLCEGDANIRFFHLQTYHRGRQNRIDLLLHNDAVLVDESKKAKSIFTHFDEILGNYEPRTARLDFEALLLPSLNLHGLDHCFSEDEVWAAIRDLPREKALGPDGFTGLFYQTAWSKVIS
jgi:hypothetical protein